MNETTASSAAGLVASIGGLTLALFGVGYYALLWAGIGAGWALYRAETMPLPRAFFFAFLSTLAGAALGSALAAWSGIAGNSLLIVGSLVSGYGANAALDRLLNSGLRKIDPEGEKK